MAVQIYRRGFDRWEIHRYAATRIGEESIVSSEVIGFVQPEGDRYVVFLPRWTDGDYVWEKMERTFTVARAAVRWVIERRDSAS